MPNDSSLEDESTPASTSNPTNSTRRIVRRRRPPSQPPPIKAMSLVGLKNLFFSQTRTPLPRHQSKPKPNLPHPEHSDWSNVSSEPLLPSSHNSDNGDLESQSSSIDSKTEKANSKKGFRIDARVISDATIGLSDGLTVPFALTAGLSALGNTKVVIYGGFAELIAGAISMGLGGYLGAKSEAYVFLPLHFPFIVTNSID